MLPCENLPYSGQVPSNILGKHDPNDTYGFHHCYDQDKP